MGCTLAASFLSPSFFQFATSTAISSRLSGTFGASAPGRRSHRRLASAAMQAGVMGRGWGAYICQETQAEKLSQLNAPLFSSVSFSSRRLFLTVSMRKLQKGRRYENQSREVLLAGTNPWLHLPLCPHDSQSGLQTHNKRSRNIPTQCRQSPREAANCWIELGCGFRRGKKVHT